MSWIKYPAQSSTWKTSSTNKLKYLEIRSINSADGVLSPRSMRPMVFVQYEYIKEELPDLFALSDVVISRAGANAICEISALHKPNLLIPLSANASRGDQILNARSFEKQGFSMVLEEEEITDEKLLDTIHQLYDNRHSFEEAMSAGKQMDSIHHIVSLIEECVLSKK